MNDRLERPDEPDDDDTLAAEFVLGLLEPGEMRRLGLRAEDDRAFGRLVDEWRARLSGLDAEFPTVAPPAAVKAAIDRRLFAGEPTPAAGRPGLWGSLWAWRALATGALAALAVVLFLGRQPETPTAPLVAASLTGDAGMSFIAVYDPGAAELRIRRTAGAPPSDRDLELWLIEGTTPRSLGVIGAEAAVPFPAGLPEGTTLAVSVEPPGGSPTGQPTGPVVASGAAESI